MPSTKLGRPFVISSPSGGGKTTVSRELLASVKGLTRSVSVTTRPPRPNEKPGRDYRFVSLAEFEDMQRTGQLLEWARVHGAYYGTPKAPVERALNSGKDVLLSLDVQGARSIRRHYGKRAVLLFLEPPSMTHLRSRLMRRQTDAPEAIRARLEAARQELSCREWYDYAVVNKKLEDAVKELSSIITAERLRVASAR